MFGPQYAIGDLAMVFYHTKKQAIQVNLNRFIVDQNLSVKQSAILTLSMKMRKQEINKKSAVIDSTVLIAEVKPLIENELTSQKCEPRIPQNYLTEDNDFVEIEVLTPKLNVREKKSYC